MRLGLAQQLSLLLIGAVMVTTLTIGSVVAWSLRKGFSDYLRAREEQQLDRFVGVIERRARTDPQFGWLRHSREAMRQLIDEHEQGEQRSRRPPPAGPQPEDMGAQHDPDGHPAPPDWPAPARPGDDRPPPPPPPDAPPPRRPGSLAGRVEIFDADHRRVAGRPPQNGDVVVSHAIKVNGQVIGYANLSLQPEPNDIDLIFLRQQYSRLIAVVVATLVLSVVAAVLIARRWSRPLKALQRAAGRIARGDFLTRIEPRGATEIAAAMGDMNVMAQTLAAQEASRRRWVAQISHELRTPLAVLQGEMEAIEDGAREVTPALLSSLRDEVLQLNRLVNDLHTLSMADMGEMKCVMREGNACDALLRCVRRFEVPASKNGIELRVADQPAPVMAHWDFGRIDQMLGNLLENSMRYTQAPGCVAVSWQASSLRLILVVEDSPPGVRPEQLPMLFEPLYRTDSARQRQGSSGSGLGLAIARAIVQAHQGQIQAQPSALGGLAVVVELPLRPA
jgi:two-component system sensor histidine kinase BaeS